ncbi:AAA-domain-containing protein [Ceraceosorus guamensis]|uniref:AAA-domain-containing protein n=1 Tax=Ceraceosorus guamensis TaxID=1522189 RepID=A0A316VQA0_9BASI|nr:AAA-domain-containing protein [Ceraceosorus guamensis]PWN39777.1 AAA-domain-containing protein [Ceraceosorus guamensis]
MAFEWFSFRRCLSSAVSWLAGTRIAGAAGGTRQEGLRAEVVSRSEAQIHRLHKEEKVLLNALLNMRLEHQNLVLPDQEEEFSIGHARFVVRLKFDDPTGEREEVVGGTSSQPRTSQAKDVHPLTSSIRRVDSQTRYRICIPPADSARVSSDVPARRQAASISGAEEASASSKKAYEGLGGLDAPIEDLRKLVEMPLLRPDVFRTYGLRPPSGVLLYGPPGTGKTSLASACAQSLGLSSSSIIHLSGPSLSSSLHGRTESRLRKVFSTAKKRAPSVIIIDEIDALAPRREAGAGNDAAGEVERRVVATLLTLMDGLGKEEDEGNVIVIAATNRPNALDPALRRPGRLDREIEIGVPTPSSRLSILKVLLRHVPHALSDEEISRLAQTTHGFVGADLASLVREAGMLAVQRQLVSTSSSTFKEAPKSIDSATDSLRALTLATSTISEHESEVLPKVDASGVLDWRDFTSAKLHVRPSALREVIQTLPTVSWSDIGVGSPDSDSYRIRKEIREVVEWPIKRSKQLKRMGVRPPKGALLYGPPGCSKTLIARALATESGINFVAVKGNELYNKFVGESERALREVFARARAASPSIIFFDELDALCSTRGDQGGAVSDGVIATLLTEMDGVDSLDGVVVIAATNRPQAIDPAILRPGRLDRLLYVGPPDEDTRLQILRIRTRSMPLGDKVDLLAIARATSGHSGAEMVAICQDAGMVALDEDMDIEHVHQRHFESAIRSTKKRISLEMIRGLEKWRDQVGV